MGDNAVARLAVAAGQNEGIEGSLPSVSLPLDPRSEVERDFETFVEWLGSTIKRYTVATVSTTARSRIDSTPEAATSRKRWQEMEDQTKARRKLSQALEAFAAATPPWRTRGSAAAGDCAHFAEVLAGVRSAASRAEEVGVEASELERAYDLVSRTLPPDVRMRRAWPNLRLESLEGQIATQDSPREAGSAQHFFICSANSTPEKPGQGSAQDGAIIMTPPRSDGIERFSWRHLQDAASGSSDGLSDAFARIRST